MKLVSMLTRLAWLSALACLALGCARAAEDASGPVVAAASPGSPEREVVAADSPRPAPPSPGPERASQGDVPPSPNAEPVVVTDRYAWLPAVDPENTIASRIATPPGFTRVPAAPGSFAAWLRTLPVKPGRPTVKLHDGRDKPNQAAHALVIDIDTGKGDLQQCADAVMRLWAEYLYSHERFEQIHFNFTTGDRASYSFWRTGGRPRVDNNKVSWAVTARPDPSYAGFRAYLTSVFTYAGTASLSRELRPRALAEIAPGDVFIVGGFPGHAVLVVDVARKAGSPEARFLLAQSYMPAQDMHVLENPQAPELSPWYSTEFEGPLVTPEWTFTKDQLRHFVEAAGEPRVPVGLACLSRHYGGRAATGEDGRWYLRFQDVSLLYDDGLTKSEEDWLERPDLEDTLRHPYEAGSIEGVAQSTTDPGRARHLELLRSAYGRTDAEVQGALVAVKLAGHSVMVHRNIAAALGRVSERLTALLARDPTAAPFLEQLGGGFQPRVIAGTNRLSAHAFGIAVDLNPQRAAYFRWNGTWDGKYHQGIVDAFEAEGFIWGGRWKDFDSMHFEYRPELLDPQCREAGRSQRRKP